MRTHVAENSPEPSGDGGPGPPPPGRSPLRFLPLLLVGLSMVAVFASGLHRELTLDTLLARRDQLQGLVDRNYAVVLLGYMGVYIVAVALSIPGALFLTLFGGFLFGWLVGGLATVIAATIGAVILFLAARTSIGDALVARAGPRLQGLAKGFEQDAFSYILLLRLLPVVPFWLANLAPALFGVKVRTFAAATVIGIIPGTFAFTATGAGLDSVIAAKREGQRACQAAGAECAVRFGLADVLTPQLLGALGALALVALLPMVLRRVYGHRLSGAGGGGPA